MLPRRLSLMLMEGHKTPMYHGLVINSNEERDGEILTYENKYKYKAVKHALSACWQKTILRVYIIVLTEL